MFAAALACAGSAGTQGPNPTRPRPLPKQLPQVVLAEAGDDAIPVAGFGLGDGGVTRRRGGLRFHERDGCVTPGGVHVVCRSVGVKLVFPSGRELLLGPDGVLHLRSGESGGPFPSGVEFVLADGARVRVRLAQGRRDRVRDVWVVHGDSELQPRRRGKPAEERSRAGYWRGDRLACCGDGGELYLPVALGPMIVLDRVMVPKDRIDETPRERLVLLTDPLRRSLEKMPKQHRETDVAVRRAVAAVAGVAERGAQVFPVGAALRRAERDRLRWLLAGGFELQLALDGPLAPRLQLFAGTSPLPMVEWTLGAASAAYLTNPRDDQLGKRWHGNGTRLPRSVPDLQVRDDVRARARALRVIERLQR